MCLKQQRPLPQNTIVFRLKKDKKKNVTLGCYFVIPNYFPFPVFRFGDVSLQESINQENFELLKEYYTVFMEKMPPDCKYASYRKQQ